MPISPPPENFRLSLDQQRTLKRLRSDVRRHIELSRSGKTVPITDYSPYRHSIGLDDWGEIAAAASRSSTASTLDD